MQITKDTELYFSISEEAGNFGASFHNAGFEYYRLDKVYIPLSFVSRQRLAKGSDSIAGFIDVARPAGLTFGQGNKQMLSSNTTGGPLSPLRIGVNTTIVKYRDDPGPGEPRWKYDIYNTDFSSVLRMLEQLDDEEIIVLGNGAYAKTVELAAARIKKTVTKITRADFNLVPKLSNCTIFNATPVKNLEEVIQDSVQFVDCDPNTRTGYELAYYQGTEQFKLFTDKEYPIDFETCWKSYCRRS